MALVPKRYVVCPTRVGLSGKRRDKADPLLVTARLIWALVA